MVGSGALADTNDVSQVVLKAYGRSVIDDAGPLIDDLVLSGSEFAHFSRTIEIFSQAGFSAGQCLDYLKLTSELQRAGISLQDLASKVREGVAKKVSPERISAVMEDRVRWLKSARVVVLSLENEGVAFLDKQMSYRVLADYLARGVAPEEISQRVLEGDLSDYPALGNVIR